jgi:hypothetical protein
VRISAGIRGVSVNRNRLVMSLNRLVGFFMIFSPFLSGNVQHMVSWTPYTRCSSFLIFDIKVIWSPKL